MARIGVFYDGGFFFHVSNYYQHQHERRQRLSVGGLHQLIRHQVATLEKREVRYCPISEAHYFRGRPRAIDVADRDSLYRERVFDDVLVREGVRSHYLPLARDGERGLDVSLSLEAYSLALQQRFAIAVLLVGSSDFSPLVRRLVGHGIRVMIPDFDLTYIDPNGVQRDTVVSSTLLDEATYPICMNSIIEEEHNKKLVDDLFVPSRRESVEAPQSTDTIVDGVEVVGVIDAVRNGYGFITPSLGGENIFFHYRDCDTPFESIRPGVRVEYVMAHNDRGPCAKNVHIMA